jgi:hypothetical protein
MQMKAQFWLTRLVLFIVKYIRHNSYAYKKTNRSIIRGIV